MENYNTNDGSVVTSELIEGYLAEARQAYVSSKEAAARSAAYIYLTWKATLSDWAKQADKETILEGVGEYCEESNTLYLLPCPECDEEMEVSGWLEECEECGERHYEVDKCE